MSFFYSFHLLEWRNDEKVDRYEVLRLIYQGRFLHGNVTLSALRLQQGNYISQNFRKNIYFIRRQNDCDASCPT